MSAENVELVRRALDAWNRGDAESAEELLAPEIRWQLPPHFPDAETWSGRERVVEGLRALGGSWSTLRLEVRELIDAGDRVVALVRYSGQAAMTGLELEGAGVDSIVWTIRAGLVVEVHMYGGTADALAAAGLPARD
jgi:ketosteroid isomerase-like protein